MKDAEAVPILLSVLANKENKKRHAASAGALATIGNRQAVEGFVAILRDPKSESQHFTVDGTMIEGWASLKSFQPKTLKQSAT